jgi:signal peptide peptidase SppA
LSKRYIHVAARVFGTPLAVHEEKLKVITGYLVPRFRGEDPGEPEGAVASRQPYAVTADGIAVIDVCGTLVDRAGGMDAFSGLTGYPEIEAEFVQAQNDAAVRGVLLRIDSPGGEVGGMYDLADRIYAARGSKPVYAMADGAMASAAYLIGSAADRVFVKRTSLAGSIGIIALHLDQSAYDEKQGFHYTAVYAGARKNDGNPHVPLSDDALATLQARVDKLYAMFADTVARNRGIAASAVIATEAAIYLGSDAIGVGLADVMGTFPEALAAIQAAATPRVSILTPSRVSNAVAESATNLSKEGISMPEPKADAPAAPAAVTNPAGASAPSQGDVAVAVAQGFAKAFAIVEMCAVARLTAQEALAYLKPDATAEAVGMSLLRARAAKDAAEPTASNILPEAGADPKAQTKPEDSPVVKAAEKRAERMLAHGGRS